MNALIHADHRGLGGVVIERYADRLEQALRARFGELFTGLDKRAVQAVATAQVEGSINNGRLQ